MDMINRLPNEILCRILNLFPIKEAATTCILSKRWMNLFAFTPDLDLCYVESENTTKCNKSFIRFVDRVLALSGDFTMRKFSLKLDERVTSSSAHVNRWMINVLNRGILELALDMYTKDVVTLPLDIFHCETLVKLELGRFVDITMVPENASLPALKTLSLKFIKFSDYAFEALISACPVLEELTVLGNPWNGEQSHTVSSPTLKRLVIEGISSPWSRRISFDTPSLAYLDYFNSVIDVYPTVNFNSLVEANLDMQILTSKSTLFTESNPRNLIKGLRNVKILNLSSFETSEVLYYFAEAIPLFENLSQLSIKTRVRHCWRGMPLLLKKAPKLETLVINGPLHYYDSGYICECLGGYSFLSTCPVKVLEITDYKGTKEELKHMKQFMKKLTCLELVIVHVFKKAKVSCATDLLMLPVACKIQDKPFA